MDADLQMLLDHRAVIDVNLAYAHALDAREWESLRDCFTADAVADYVGIGLCAGVEAIIDQVRTGLEYLDRSQHYLSNFRVTLDGDRATCTSYLHAQHVRDGDTFVIAGCYSDELTRTPEGWRIAHRRLEIWWTDGNRAVITPGGRADGARA